MDRKWKRIFLMSSVGGLAIGAVVALARRPRRQEAALPSRPLPRDFRALLAWTERFEVEEGGKYRIARDRYLIQPSRFRLWSVLDLGTPAHAPSRASSPIHHISHFRLIEVADEAGPREEEQLLDRFYGTVEAQEREGTRYARNAVARGALLVSEKCYVGGSSNGVLSGETHRSQAAVLNYQLEYAPAEG